MFRFIKNIFKPKKKAYSELNTTEFKQAIKENNSVLIDVRTPSEFSSGKIAKAKNINVASLDFLKEAKTLDMNKQVLIYCKSGARSSRASSMLCKMGFKNVSHLKGGIGAWSQSGESIQN